MHHRDTPDHSRLARELIRALRGRRSQRAFSRRLGYASNVAYTWESGRREARASDLFRAASLGELPVAERLEQFLRERPPWLEMVDDHGLGLQTALLTHLRRGRPVSELARSIGRPRATVSRWANGRTECSVAELLAFVDAATDRLVDFVAALTDPREVPCIAPAWEQQQARRELALRMPMSQAVLRALELDAYGRLATHEEGWIATRLGVSREQECSALESLLAAGLIRWDGTVYRVEPVTVDLGSSPPTLRRSAKEFWLEEARARLTAGSPGLFSYNVAAVSEEDAERLRQLHLRYFEEARAVVAASSPSERVVVIGMQLFEL